MLHFVAGVYNSLFRTPEYHVLIVGRECAGKSTLLEQLKFLYTPAAQEREEGQLQAERRATNCGASSAPVPEDQSGEVTSSTAEAAPAHALQRQTLPPGTPLPATAAYMTQKRIRPTVGLNYAVVQHRFSPTVAVVHKVKKSMLHTAPVASLPPPPAEILAEQRARQQAVLANAPSDVVTRVVLRDLGGQTALRDLWEKYYSQTQAVVYVVDSTLPFRCHAATPAASPRDHFTRKELEDLYRPDQQLLLQLLQHPLLEDVPVLLLSNKVDETPHIPLAAVQEAMGLAELAASRAFYMHGETLSDEEERSAVSSSAHTDDTLTTSPTAAEGNVTLSRHCTRAEATQRKVGESGFGEVAMRIAEVSAVDGAGVAGAMDWLVAQLLHRARNVSADA